MVCVGISGRTIYSPMEDDAISFYNNDGGDCARARLVMQTVMIFTSRRGFGQEKDLTLVQPLILIVIYLYLKK